MGPLTAASQQWSLLKQAGIQNPNPPKQFFTHLAIQVKKWIGANCEVCIMMDANEAREDKESDLSAFLDQTTLVDAHRHFHGSENEPATYA